MSAFRLYLIARIDNEEVEYCPALAMAVQPTSFHVHVLSTTYWPKGSVSPLVFSSLKLPESLFTIAEEFEKCFHTMEGQSSVLYDAPLSSTGSSKDSNPYKTLGLFSSKVHMESDVEGEEGRLLSSSSLTHGSESTSGRFGNASAGVSRKRLLWCHGLGTVTLSFRCTAATRRTTTAASSSSSSSIYEPSSSTTSLFMTPRTRPSSSSSSINHASLKHTITLIVTTPQAAVLLALDPHYSTSPSSFTSPSPGGRAGLGQDNSSSMGGTWTGKESSSDRMNGLLTERELSLVTGLHGEELRVVVQSLCDPSLPLLQTVTYHSNSQINPPKNNNNNNSNNNNDSSHGSNREGSMMMTGQGVERLYRLSDDFLNGSLVGTRDHHHHHHHRVASTHTNSTSSKQDQPLLMTDPSKWSHIMTQLQQTHPVSVRAALKTWREALVDACIVREMKRAAREKSGRVSAQINALQLNQWSHPVQECLTLEELSARVKVVLETNRLRCGTAPGMLMLWVVMIVVVMLSVVTSISTCQPFLSSSSYPLIIISFLNTHPNPPFHPSYQIGSPSLSSSVLVLGSNDVSLRCERLVAQGCLEQVTVNVTNSFVSGGTAFEGRKLSHPPLRVSY